MKTLDYNAVALKILPPGSHHGLTYLRSTFAATLEREINAALTRQREEEFPDLAATRAELARRSEQLDSENTEMKRKNRDKQKELDDRERDIKQKQDTRECELNKRERAIREREQGLTTLLAAIDAYGAWFDGDGDVDENGQRFEALWQACQAYRGQKPKGV